MEKLAPVSLAEKWDNIGLQIGNPAKKVNRVLVAVDLLEEVAMEAVQENVDMVVTHHPFIFDPVKTLREDSFSGKVASMLIKNDIALYCTHTNLDSAPGGINHLLAEMLGLKGVKILQVSKERYYNKIVVFVPAGYEDRVRTAMAEAGAGWIGNYSHCTFQVRGTGTFMPGENTSPFIGEQGRLEKADEFRLETIVPEELTPRVVNAMVEAHPYEEVAYDIYGLKNEREGYGLGRIGMLPEEMALGELAGRVKHVLELKHVKCSGNLNGKVLKVALCGGSGGSLIEKAALMGADVYLTGDIKYHDAHKSLSLGMAVIDAGHYGTEKIAVDIIKNHIENEVRGLNEKLEVIKSRIDIDPFAII
jgi:dinuclear metal center YbgI/SA1388 family protein